MRSTSLTPIIPFSQRLPFVESETQQVITATTAVVARSSLVHFSPGQTDHNLRDPFPGKVCPSFTCVLHRGFTAYLPEWFLPEEERGFFFFFLRLLQQADSLRRLALGDELTLRRLLNSDFPKLATLACFFLNHSSS